MSTPKWRIALGVLVLVLLGLFAVNLVPLYYHNYRLQEFVSEAAQRVENRTKSDDALRDWVLDHAAALALPVKAGDVHIKRSAAGLRIDVRYVAPVNLPGYTVLLHFSPGAGNE